LCGVLDGLDDVDWAGLTHAYGSATDTPELLRQAGSADREAASQALSDLYSSIFHQGTVYEATAAAVPFLVDLAREAPHQRDDLVWMVGMVADDEHAYGPMRQRVRDALAEQAEALVALMANDDPQVRVAAAYAACRAGAPADVFWDRWSTEDDPEVRASLVLALGEVDLGRADSVLPDAMLHAAPAVRVAAAAALLRRERSWPDGAVAALIDAINEGARIPYGWSRGADWYDELLEVSADAVAASLLDQMLGSSNPKTREMATWAMGVRCDELRSAAAALVPMLAPVLEDPDPDVRLAAFRAVRRAGAAARQFADLLAAVAAAYPDVAGNREFTVEYLAVQTLVRLGDPRWVAPVCAAATAGHRDDHVLWHAGFTPDVLAEIRPQLARDPAVVDLLAGPITEWGRPAAAAAPELLAALRHAGPRVARALLALGIDDPDMVPHLRGLVTKDHHLPAALAFWRITGDATPMLDTLAGCVSGEHHFFDSWTVDLSLGAVLRPLLPTARRHLTGVAATTTPQRHQQILAARITAAAGGAESALATTAAVLIRGDTPARAAAELIADLAPTHRSLVADLEPQLRDRLRDQWSRLSATRALVRLGVPTAELVSPLVLGLTDYAGRFGIATILELRAVETIPALEELLARDERFDSTGDADSIVWADELLQERVRSAIAELRS
jgi:hypothetical protein